MSPRVRVYIKAIEVALPEKVLTNEELSADTEWSADKIESKTGIAARRIAAQGELSSDLAVAAAKRLFAGGACAPTDIDFILLCTQSPDYLLPTTACLVQDRLGIPTSAGALDFNLGCSGYVYGLSLAKGLIETGQAKNVLLITAETYSKFIHPRDRSVRTLFGDGATASLVCGAVGEVGGVDTFVFGTDGSGGPHLIVPSSGLREPHSAETAAEVVDESGNTRSRDNLFMNGTEVFTFTLREVPKAVQALLARSGDTLDTIDLFVFHQANTFMLEHLRKKMKLPAEKFVVAMRDVGNTVSSTIPIALKAALDDGRLRDGARVMLVGFGVGYSWAGCTITWGAPLANA